MSLTLLIAEDDRDLAEVIAYGARQAWPDCRVVLAADGREALARFKDERPDLVVLDVAMPPPDGVEVCRRIRQESRVPILMLTVRGGLLDKVRALDLGADDYLTKPFDHLELFARPPRRRRARRARPGLPVGRAHGGLHHRRGACRDASLKIPVSGGDRHGVHGCRRLGCGGDADVVAQPPPPEAAIRGGDGPRR